MDEKREFVFLGEFGFFLKLLSTYLKLIKKNIYALGGRKKHPIAICLMLITELVCVVTLMREWTGLRIFGMTIAQCISKATHIYVGSAVTQSHVADFDF